MTTILLIGAGGQLGQELQRTLPALGEVISISRKELDLTDREHLQQTIHRNKPDVIVNAAAYTAVDKAEREPELAAAINGTAPTVMAEIADRVGACLIHVSTDYVFDGQNCTPYLETDPCNPLSVYGRSKLAGEQGIRQVCDRHLILRTAWVYGSSGSSNFVKTMLHLGASREEIRVVSDQIGAPTWAADLAHAITTFAAKNIVSTGNGSADHPDPSFWGTYHFTNSGVASWYDFAVAIFEMARQLQFPLQVRRVLPIATEEYPTPAKRPAYSVLSPQKTAQVLGCSPAYWRQSLQKMLVELHAYTYESPHSLRR